LSETRPHLEGIATSSINNLNNLNRCRKQDLI